MSSSSNTYRVVIIGNTRNNRHYEYLYKDSSVDIRMLRSNSKIYSGDAVTIDELYKAPNSTPHESLGDEIEDLTYQEIKDLVNSYKKD